MKLLITGATGFLGHHAIQHFKNDFEVVGLSRTCSRQEKNLNIIKTDYSLNNLIKIAKGFDAILHLAACRPNNSELNLLKENVSLDFNVLHSAYELGIDNLIYISSRGVYGAQPIPWRENLEVSPENLYTLAKCQSEQMADYYIKKGLKIKVLRLAQLLGLGEYKGNVIRHFVESAYYKKAITLTVSGIEREYIYIKDALVALEVAIKEKNISGIFNVGSEEILTLKEMAVLISKAFGYDDLVLEDIKAELNERSLMNSGLFRERFNWCTKYDFESGVKDMAESLKDPLIASFYGL